MFVLYLFHIHIPQASSFIYKPCTNKVALPFLQSFVFMFWLYILVTSNVDNLGGGGGGGGGWGEEKRITNSDHRTISLCSFKTL